MRAQFASEIQHKLRASLGGALSAANYLQRFGDAQNADAAKQRKAILADLEADVMEIAEIVDAHYQSTGRQAPV